MREVAVPVAKRLICCAAILLPSGAAAAETELGFYLGAQSAPHSRVEVDGDPRIPDEDFLAGWEGRSFDPPLYYGLRATRWSSDSFGFGLDFVHAKVYTDDETRQDNDYDVLEFTDGINVLTVNVYRRWEEVFAGLTPYLGAGIGVSVPRVEVAKNGSETFEYQYTGPAASVIAGASYPIVGDWAVFGEYKGTYSRNTADLDSGGTLETDVVTNALNLGVSFSF